ncbi:hypothetical protein MINS_24790 [Mycolicibacterium insubricum]|uniref:Uncharacterized protein n=1 Tax=Mycolicibacterium insubricum TaxID=444597 RepID=A0A1X0DFT1_9MYCO|nr:DUF202 domain-containing protein [Mycolicibacterium insubricum]MCV7081452.1 DUF202 domain-containing protein [Mycolicibacterium insubricum]ORA71029.1 hypothetical protein BST26_09110 [Mycolicibacterium insubricum]BBZ67050.1 hypothetical protein MINS_24790 [Mycolicibacterium insubricum]
MTDEPPCLQNERTELAWERTALSVAALAGIVLFREIDAVWAPFAAVTGLLSLVIFGAGRLRSRRSEPATVAIPLVGWSIGALALVLLILFQLD